MIQPAPVTPALPGLPGEAALLSAADPAQGAEFGALLALQGMAADLTASDAGDLPALPVALPAPASLAATAGKILPPTLPEEPAVAGPAAVPAPPLPHMLAIRATGKVPAAAAAPAEERESDTASAEPLAEDSDTTLAISASEPLLPAVGLSAPVVHMDKAPALGTSPNAVSDAVNRATRDDSIPAHAPVSHALPKVATGFPTEGMAVVPPASGAQPAPARPQPAETSAPAEEVRIGLALPRLAASLAANAKDTLPTLTPTLPAAESNPVAIAAPLAQPGGLALAAAPAPHVQPHDFAALIDRLSAARDAVSPQSVSITVSHQDFGAVRLHFRPEDAGLSVAMTSADPDFARAAAAAPAPVLAISASGEAAFTQNRGEGSAGQSATNGGQPQSRGSFAQQREGQEQPRANPSPRDRSDDRSGHRQGIFA